MSDFDKMIAGMDQLSELVKLIVPVLWGYFFSLTEKGFSREEALALTINLQAHLIGSNNSEK